MPVGPTYPGVYIEELPSGVRTITGVSTAVAAFVGYTQRGPTNEALQVFNIGDYERLFGGLHKDSLVSYSVQHFFLNGGSEAWIVRVAEGAAKASVSIKNGIAAADPTVLTVTAKSDGAWGNLIRAEVDYDTANPDSLFNLLVTELREQHGTLVVARVEKHRNLTMNSASPNFAVAVVNAASELIEVERPAAAVAVVQNEKATSTTGEGPALTALDDDHRRLALTLDGNSPIEFDIFDPGQPPANLGDLGNMIKARVDGILGPNSISSSVAANRLTLTAGTPNGQGEASLVRFGNAGLRNAAGILKLGLSNGGREVEGSAKIRPARSGTAGGSLASLVLSTLPATASITVTIKSAGLPADGPTPIDLWGAAPLPPTPVSLEEIRARVEAGLAGSRKAALNKARVSLVDAALQVIAGGADPNARLEFGGTVAATLQLSAAAAVGNVAQYNTGSGKTSQAQVGGLFGSDGASPGPLALAGSRANKTGIYALEDVDLFNILCLPSEDANVDLLGKALAYAAERRAFMLLDFPSSVNSMMEAKQWMSSNATLRHKNAAIYFPRIHVADPLEQGRLRAFPTCGAMAGLYARTDAGRGVWKAPAGTEASIRGVQKLDYVLTDPENGVLNPLGINALRMFPVYGPVAWGGRTLDGADQQASEWKYIPVRRFALFLEESLYRGTKWVVFEPNDEPLWAQIRLNIGAFMQGLFRQGAFQGQTPREAYFVKCDKETTTQADINLGIVNIVVGFAPLKPAEFVIIKIQQMAGQIPT